MLLRMLLTDHAVPEKHDAFCKAILALNAPDAVGSLGTPQLLPFVQRTDTVQVLARSSTIPSVGVICDDNYGVMVLEGATASLHYQGIVSGWTLWNRRNNQVMANQFFWQAATEIVAALGARAAARKRIWWLVGHSLGGAVAVMVAEKLRRSGQVGEMRVFTYGSPRPSDSGDTNMPWPSTNMWRYMLGGDRVCRQPPHSDEAQALHYFLTQQQSINCDRQTQCGQGFLLDELLFRITPLTLTANGQPGIVTSLSNSYALAISTSGTQHAMSTYAGFWARALRDAAPVTPTQYPPPPDRPVEITVRQRSINMDEALDDVRALVNTYRPTAAPQPVGFAANDPVAPRFRRRKAGHLWVVVLRDEIVDIGPTKRAAKRKASAWNKAIPADQR